MAKIDILENLEKEDFVGWIIMESISDKYVEVIGDSATPTIIDVEFKINGISFDFKQVVLEMYKQYEEQVNQSAEKKIRPIVEKIYSSASLLRDMENKVREDLGMPKKEWYDFDTEGYPEVP